MLDANELQVALLSSASTQECSTQPSAGLLTIPQEIRDQIYDHLLVRNHLVIQPCRRREQRARASPYTADRLLKTYAMLSATCRQLQHEARAHLFEHNIFGFEQSLDCTAPFDQNLKYMRHIALHRWINFDGNRGSCDYVCLLDVATQGLSLEYKVRMATLRRNTSFEGMSFCGEIEVRSADMARRAERLVEEKREYVMTVVQTASAWGGELNLAMLLQFKGTLEGVLRSAECRAEWRLWDAWKSDTAF